MNQAEHDEIEQFNDEMWRARHAPMSRGEFTIIAVAFLIYVAFIIYLPLSVAFGWWPA